MELVMTVGVPIVCFVFGLIIGQRRSVPFIQEAVAVGMQQGAQITLKTLVQSGLLTQEQLMAHMSGLPPEPEQPQQDEAKTQVGFNLKGTTND